MAILNDARAAGLRAPRRALPAPDPVRVRALAAHARAETLALLAQEPATLGEKPGGNARSKLERKPKRYKIWASI